MPEVMAKPLARTFDLLVLLILVTACGQTAPTISGTITLAPALQGKVPPGAILFVIARQGGGGPPLAVQKIRRPEFPLRYFLTSDDLIIPGTPFVGEVAVTARVDADGKAGPPQPGDMAGSYRNNPAKVSERRVDMEINILY